MRVNNRPPRHPGETLRWELQMNGVTQTALAKKMKVPIQHVNQLVNGRRSVTARTAWMLVEALGGKTPEFWMKLQTAFDLWRARRKR